MTRALAAATALAAPYAFAHPGHAAGAASHWHATDLFGLLALGAIGMAIAWFSRGGK